ncbi:MAG: hypothetical protein JO232_13175 [Verrucomicrobia bacterium]|nr:hypothetical protein [Verrucomicrobiota bacterium]
MDPFKQSFLNGEEVDTEVYRFGKQGDRVGMLSAGLYASSQLPTVKTVGLQRCKPG